jgi:Holliday junction DNA helicase RuvA
LLNISLNTYTGLQGQTSAKLLVHENIREDAWSLYGFASERERTLFRALIGVSGVGAGTARVILSGFTTAELEQAIAGGDVKALKNVKGIGGKTAERIIVDLRDKIKPEGDTLLVQATANNDVFDEALAALVMLGYTRQQSQKALKKLFDADPTLKVENAIKKALALM